jgi:hypothetical protein
MKVYVMCKCSVKSYMITGERMKYDFVHILRTTTNMEAGELGRGMGSGEITAPQTPQISTWRESLHFSGRKMRR